MLQKESGWYLQRKPGSRERRGACPTPTCRGRRESEAGARNRCTRVGGGEPGSQPRGAEEAEEKEDLEESLAPQRHRNPLAFPVATPATAATSFTEEIERGRRRTAPGCRWQQEALVSLQQQDSRPGTPTGERDWSQATSITKSTGGRAGCHRLRDVCRKSALGPLGGPTQGSPDWAVGTHRAPGLSPHLSLTWPSAFCSQATFFF